MNSVIQADKLSKTYRLGLKQADGYHTFRETLMAAASAPFKRLRGSRRTAAPADEPNRASFFALKDVSFDVKPGEVVGIIGRNGAGKSTLLKILSRVTEPSSGRVVVRGRIGSLLEVGTGFHPELTGRENIFLNGSILGMSRVEIIKQFDSIVEFADISQFLDTPVKRYSSGMYVRLAFAIAAHLNPEILIVDEVLAVGDVSFQKKCLNKMEEVSQAGRTVLFVSHNMQAIQRLCTCGMLMNSGRLVATGDKQDIINQYMAGEQDTASPNSWIDVTQAVHRGSGQARFTGFQYRVAQESTLMQPYPDCACDIGLRIESDVSRSVGSLGVIFCDRFGTRLVNADIISLSKIVELRNGHNEIWFRINSLHLNPGIYTVRLWLSNYPLIFDFIESAFTIEIVDLPVDENIGRRPYGDGVVTCSISMLEGP